MASNKLASVRFRLRDATLPAHARLDSLASRWQLTSRADYTAFLAAQASALIPLEHTLEDIGIAYLIPDWQARSRSQALRADLDQLSIHFAALHAPKLESAAAMFGAAYVLEGSRLGAPVLLARVKESTDPKILSATRFLRHGEAARFWQSFQPMLEAGIESDIDGAIEGALAAFSLFERSFAEVLSEAVH